MSSQISQVGTTISFQQQSSYVITPTQIPGCALWLDAADASTMTFAGSKVSQWNDKSGNGRNAVQAVSGSQPTYTTYGLNFANATMATTLTSVPIYENAFVIGYISSTGGDIFAPTTGGGRRNRFIGANLYYEAQSIATLLYSPTTINTNTSYLFNFNATPSSLAILINGTTSASTNGCNSTNFTGGGTTNIGFSGLLYEMVIFSTALTTPQRQQVEGYLAWKWGLTGNLPTNHPYAINPPAYFGGTLPLINYIGLSAQTGYIQAPTQIPGCALWLDGSDASTVLLSGSTVTQWNDKSGYGRNFTITSGSTYPPSSAYLQNSLNGMYTTGNFAGTSSSFVLSTTSDISFFCVITSIVAGAAAYFGSSGLSIYLASTNVFELYVNGNYVPLLTLTVSVPYLLLITISSAGQVKFSYNGSTPVIQSGVGAQTIFSTANSYNISGNPQNTNILYEYVAYNTVLGTTQRQQIEGYLAWKWGLQAKLPSSHPYYVAAPAYFGTLPIQASLTFQKQWRPTNISGCALWLDAADLSSIVLSGSSVTQWNDKSGNGYNAATPTNTITYNATPINGKPTITFNANASLTTNSITYSTTYRTVYVLIQVGGAFNGNLTNNYRPVVSNVGNIGVEIFSYNGDIEFDYYHQGLTYTANPVGLFNTTSILMGTNSPGNVGIFVSGNSQTLGGNLTGSYSFSIGSAAQLVGNNGGIKVCIIGEIIIYDGAQTVKQQQQVEGYLAWKWGLTSSLPNNHPNKYMPPS